MKNEPTPLVKVEPMSENDFPFVNEECGDTMWDAVLAQTTFATINS